MKPVALLLLLMSVCIAACGPVETDALPTQFQPRDTPVPVDVDIEGLAEGEFRLESSGAVDAGISGAGAFFDAEGRGYAVNLTETGDLGLASGVILALPYNIAPGTYPLFSHETAFNGLTLAVQATGAQFVVPAPVGSALPLYAYDEIREGSLTLTSVEPLTGAFAFTAGDRVDGTVSVRGAFNALPLDASVD